MKRNILLIFTTLVSVACSQTKSLSELKGQTMGTYYKVKFVEDVKVDKGELKKEIDDHLREVNRQMSTYIKDSEISRLNSLTQAEKFPVSPWFGKVLQFSLDLAQKTDGYFDPTIGPLVNLWGFGPQGERKVPQPDVLAKTMEKVGYSKVSLMKEKDRWFVQKTRPDVYVDLSASAKGFGVDALSELLTQKGLRNHLVEIGGEIRVQGRKNGKDWTLAIETPDEAQRGIQKVLKLSDMSLATSGNYRNFFKEGGVKYGHTINQKTGKPTKHRLLSVSIIAKTCMEADGLATAMMAMGEEKAYEFAQSQGIAAYFININKEGSGLEVRFTDAFSRFNK